MNATVGPETHGTFEDRYSTAPQPFASWALAQLDLSDVTAAADVGCGDGRFTLPLARALVGRSTVPDAPVEVVGVIERAWRSMFSSAAASREGLPIRTMPGDALDASIFPTNSLDLVMLNLVLHLMPRRDAVHQCLNNAREWLRPEGSLLIAGYGSRHMSESFTWLREALMVLGRSPEEAQQLSDRKMRSFGSRPFVLEDGIRVLAPAFDVVTYRGFEDTLLVPVDELVDAHAAEPDPLSGTHPRHRRDDATTGGCHRLGHARDRERWPAARKHRPRRPRGRPSQAR